MSTFRGHFPLSICSSEKVITTLHQTFSAFKNSFLAWSKFSESPPVQSPFVFVTVSEPPPVKADRDTCGRRVFAKSLE